MSTNHDKQESLALETKIKQTCKRLLRGVGAIRENPAKAVPIVPFYALLTVFYAARHKLLGYAPGDLLAPLNDLLAVLVTGVPAVAAPPAPLWAVQKRPERCRTTCSGLAWSTPLARLPR